jgi:hypothetical protein
MERAIETYCLWRKIYLNDDVPAAVWRLPVRSVGTSIALTTTVDEMRRGQRGLTVARLRELAKAGAEATLKELRAEIIAIERAFPELAFAKRRRAVQKATARTRRMSAAARKAVSVRMKRYWAERRKAKARMK